MLGFFDKRFISMNRQFMPLLLAAFLWLLVVFKFHRRDKDEIDS